jgi:Methyltransferase domain/Glycosyl transferase family 2
MMDFRTYLTGVSFALIDETQPPTPDGRFRFTRSDGAAIELLNRQEAPLDIANSILPDDDEGMRQRLRDVCRIPRMSTLAIGAAINYGVALMAADRAFVNVGIWNGFTFLSAIVGNQGKTCIGIDNFSQFGGPRDAFRARFGALASTKHRFFDIDYRDYFSHHHTEQIGFYIYDGDHSYEDQLLGLRMAEPYFAEDCIVLVDDTNWPEPRQATLDFVAESRNGYELLLDRTTCSNAHPTWWNGVMVFQRIPNTRFAVPFATVTKVHETEDSATPDASSGSETVPPEDVQTSTRKRGNRPLLSVVVDAYRSQHGLAEEISSALNEEWTDLEVVIVDAVGNHRGDENPGWSGNGPLRLVTVGENEQAVRFRSGLKVTTGETALLIDADDQIDPSLIASVLSDVRWADQRQTASTSIRDLIPPGRSFLLVDQLTLGIDKVGDRNAIPFLEHNGQYWGPPADDETAVRELERMRAEGASHIVFAWPAYWWLEYYAAFASHLRAHFPLVLANERVIAYDLRSEVSRRPVLPN